MKRLFLFLVICALLLSSLSGASFSAASSDFVIQDGVLVKYNGSSSEVAVPDDVTAIGASAFESNTSLKSVTLGASVYSVGSRAFYGCSALQTVSGGINVSEVGDMAFRDTPYLEDSTDKFLMLGNVLLWYNGISSNVTVPSHCNAVASYAFAHCEYLKSVTANEGLISIGAGAFYGCGSLSAVDLPSTVSEIGAYAFDGTPFLDSLGSFAIVGDGVLIKYQGAEQNVVIPDTVRRVASRAFTSSKLVSVSLPQSVYAIDAYAFADCVGLEEIQLSEGLVTIGDQAFRGCRSLNEIRTPATLSYIGQSVFNGASSLNNAFVCGNDLSVSYNAFKGCDGLKYVLLSNGVSAVRDNAFNGCSSLEGITVPSAAKSLSPSALDGCDKAVVCCEKGSAAENVFSSHKVNTVMGDVDSDGYLDIVDATVIQRYLAYIMPLNGTQTASADFDFDGEISIVDAYSVQMKLALFL